jgi:hypothetical protein
MAEAAIIAFGPTNREHPESTTLPLAQFSATYFRMFVKRA